MSSSHSLIIEKETLGESIIASAGEEVKVFIILSWSLMIFNGVSSICRLRSYDAASVTFIF